MRPSSQWLRLIALPLLILVLIGLFTLNQRLTIGTIQGIEFLPKWNAARAWSEDGSSPYAPEVSAESQRLMYGRASDPALGERLGMFAAPLYALWIYAPFGLFTFETARSLWMLVLELGLPLLATLGLRIARGAPKPLLALGIMLFPVVWYPGARAILLGEPYVIEALLLAGMLMAVSKQRDGLAGFLLGCAWFNVITGVIMTVFTGLWAISRRRWTLLAWLATTIVVLFLVSILVLPRWPLEWLWQTLERAQYLRHLHPLAILASFSARSSTLVLNGLTILFGLYLFWEWVIALRQEARWFIWTACLTLVLMRILLPAFVGVSDIILVVPLAMTFAILDKRWKRSGWILIAAVGAALIAGSWVVYLLTVGPGGESYFVSLPLSFAVLLALWWVRWWAIEPQRLPLER
jgi:hypothetical protein